MTEPNGAAGTEAYRREDVRRMLDVSERQLRAWEKKGFIEASQTFCFSDLLALKTLKRLCELGVSTRLIQLVLTSLKSKFDDVEHPLAELRITTEGRRIAVHVPGNKMEPITGQLLFDFDSTDIDKLRSFPTRKETPVPREEIRAQQAEHWFQRGLMLEETGAPIAEAIAAYRQAIELNRNASGALVNLGTIAFRSRKLQEAAHFYSRAIEADPEYPLAHFNLANLYDEQGNFSQARRHYLEAIRLNPRYADAYFNLALLCERNSDLLQAIAHWQTYLKMDSTSSWAQSARQQLERLKKTVRSK